MDRKPKTIFQLDSPFTAAHWPEISTQNQKTILEILCRLLSQIGQYRFNHITPSRGKRSKNRKRREAKTEDGPTIAIPPRPEILSFIAVGLNSITRNLESSSQMSRPKIQVIEEGGDAKLPADVVEAKKPKDTRGSSKVYANHPLEGHFSAIFVCDSSQLKVIHEHLPQFVYTASLARPDLPATRLVELPNGSEAKLCEALGISRVSVIGILEGAPHSKALVDLVRECVAEIEIPWLQKAQRIEVSASEDQCNRNLFYYGE